MKRTKRSVDSRAFNRGYQSGISGRTQDSCPHVRIDARANWLAGWRTGHDDRVSGYTGVAGLQRLPV